MLSDEEKKAIESFKEENNNDLSRFDDFNSYTQFKVKRDKIIIDLIEKQSKEIEELKNTETYKLAIIDKDKYISKDKIKAKIEEYKKQIEKDRKEIKESVLRTVIISDKEERIQELQSLLEKE